MRCSEPLPAFISTSYPIRTSYRCSQPSQPSQPSLQPLQPLQPLHLLPDSHLFRAVREHLIFLVGHRHLALVDGWFHARHLEQGGVTAVTAVTAVTLATLSKAEDQLIRYTSYVVRHIRRISYVTSHMLQRIRYIAYITSHVLHVIHSQLEQRGEFVMYLKVENIMGSSA